MSTTAYQTVKRVLTAGISIAILILVALVFRPKPTAVETALVTKGPLQVTVDEDGETRAHDRFTLAAPFAGHLSRIEFREGDEVGPGTVVAVISPLPLDAREIAEIRARIAAAEARKDEAAHELAQCESAHQQATRELRRAQSLSNEKIIAPQALEEAEAKQISTAKQMNAAKSRVQAAAADVEREQAALVSLEARQSRPGKSFAIRPPTKCRILRIMEKSERVVALGTPILVLSNPDKLEVVVDLLSADAVKVPSGAPVMIENWGGPKPLQARVRTVEPYGFTKVSALGIEEQRVNVIADFIDSPDGLGDGYRVDARIVLWENPKVLKVPASSLFRLGEHWNVFAVENGRARRHAVEIDHRNPSEVELTKGLDEGTCVILHPPNDLRDGRKVLFEPKTNFPER